MIKRVILGLLLFCTISGAAFFAIGGREGALLMYAKYVMRKEQPATQEVHWQQGPNTAKSGAARPPNIIVILADDLGFNDITLNGGGIANGTVSTPNINSIAREGVQFTAGYAGNATCSPSRAALMTGRYATRFGFEFTPVPKQFMQLIANHSAPGAIYPNIYHPENERDLLPYEDQGLPTNEITIAKLLQGSGYHTVQLGKWHLGDSPQFRPRAHGFNESLGMLHGASMFLPENDPGVVNAKQDFDPIDRFLWASEPWAIRFNDDATFKPGAYMTDYLTNEAIKVVAANKNRPFFMYLAYNAPHTPLQATREDYDALSHIEDHTTRVYAAMIRSLDRNIGRVLQSLKDQGVDDNTLVIFTSDNGGAHYVGIEGLNKPYRGWKATYYDGGTHVPYFMRWPGKLPKGASYPAMVSHFDIFATAAAAAGAAVPTDRMIDGVNLLPFMRGEAGGRPHERLFWRGGDYHAVRAGDWKLQVTKTPQRAMLYNLALDPGERNELGTREPAKVAELKAMLAEFNSQQVKPLWPSLGEAPIALDKSLKQKWQKDDAYVYFAN